MNGTEKQQTNSDSEKGYWAEPLEPEYGIFLWTISVVVIGLLLFSTVAKADYIYEANQDLYDLQTNSAGSTGLGSNDDSVSAAFDLGFTFTFYGNDFTKARMATNGCLHFNLTGSYCGDYTPDPLPQYTNTLFPFWTDLIKDGGSAMRAKAFDDYTIFGWYNMREYNRANSDNSIEVWLYPNNTYEFRYGELDIISHDVLIGEQGSSSQIYTYHFFDECNTGTTNIAGTCVSYDWNSSSNAVNTLLEDGGSLYGDGTDQSACATTPLTSVNCAGYAAAYLAQQCALNSLHSESCDGYAAAYLTQQCNITQLYSQECPSYWSAYDDQQCEDDPQYSPSCAGYTTEASVAYYVEEEQFDYGYEENYGYEDDYGYEDEYGIDDDPYYGMEFTDAEWYEIDLQEFGQEQVNEWYGTDVSFNDEGWIEWDSSSLETWEELEAQMDIYDEFVETYEYIEEVYLVSYNEFEPNPLPFDTSEELIEEFVFHETVLVEDYEDLETYIEFEIFEEIEEERLAEAEEEVLEERLAEEEEEEKKGGITAAQLNVVASTIQAASNSVSGTTAGTTSRTGGWGSTSSGGSTSGYGGSSGTSGSVGNTTTTAVASSASGGGFSTSSSPSISDQIQTAQVQTNTVLSLNQDMGSTSGMGGSTQTVSNVTTVITPLPTFDANPQVVMADVQVTDMQGQIDTAVSGVMTASEADQIADQIIADNIKEQQEQGQATQEETGQYGDESTLVAFLGYVPGFDAYREATIPQAETWYEPRAIYADASISDNIDAFYGLARTSLNTMQSLVNQQPNL
jgi:hypothetical protein